MKMTVNNIKIAVEEMEIEGVEKCSLVLIGDTEIMTCSTVYDTPKDSVIISKQVPIRPLRKETRL